MSTGQLRAMFAGIEWPNEALQWTAGERVGCQVESLWPAATELIR
jgi:hypothetical protein